MFLNKTNVPNACGFGWSRNFRCASQTSGLLQCINLDKSICLPIHSVYYTRKHLSNNSIAIYREFRDYWRASVSMESGSIRPNNNAEHRSIKYSVIRFYLYSIASDIEPLDWSADQCHIYTIDHIDYIDRKVSDFATSHWPLKKCIQMDNSSLSHLSDLVLVRAPHDSWASHKNFHRIRRYDSCNKSYVLHCEHINCQMKINVSRSITLFSEGARDLREERRRTTLKRTSKSNLEEQHLKH